MESYVLRRFSNLKKRRLLTDSSTFHFPVFCRLSSHRDTCHRLQDTKFLRTQSHMKKDTKEELLENFQLTKLTRSQKARTFYLTISIYFPIKPLADKSIAVRIRTCSFSADLIISPRSYINCGDNCLTLVLL